jgi:hypothetical protein
MISNLEAELITQAMSSLRTGQPPEAARLEVTGPSGHLSSTFAVEQTAVACVATALSAAVTLQQQRGGSAPRMTLDRGHVAAAVRSERYFLRDGSSAGAGFAPLSRFWEAADGWVRTHANYPWHEMALVSALKSSGDVEALATTMARLPAEEIERRVFAAGGVAAAVRPLAAWRDHPQGRALAGDPLIGHRRIGDAAPRARRAEGLPATGVRVLDLTRVIAGPVCTRYLAALGAEVLRLDPPDHLDMHPGAVAETLFGKRSSLLDLRTEDGRVVLDGLLGGSDVVVCGYRPGALDDFGLGEDALAERHPGLVVVYLDAWGHHGPWSGRRGFDSIVQAPTGIAAAESAGGGVPGVLPCQLLDHGTGYLAAAAVLDGLYRQADEGGTHVRRLSLARTAWWLTATRAAPVAGPRPEAPETPPWLGQFETVEGRVTAVTPPGSLDGRPLQWSFPLTGYGIDPPVWPTR